MSLRPVSNNLSCTQMGLRGDINENVLLGLLQWLSLSYQFAFLYYQDSK
jgi:hypothetical protein